MSTRLLIACEPGSVGSISGWSWPNADADIRSLGHAVRLVRWRRTVDRPGGGQLPVGRVVLRLHRQLVGVPVDRSGSATLRSTGASVSTTSLTARAQLGQVAARTRRAVDDQLTTSPRSSMPAWTSSREAPRAQRRVELASSLLEAAHLGLGVGVRAAAAWLLLALPCACSDVALSSGGICSTHCVGLDQVDGRDAGLLEQSVRALEDRVSGRRSRRPGRSSARRTSSGRPGSSRTAR